MPADVKFKNGTMKHILRQTMAPVLPQSILDRKDKMGFPVPLQEWFRGELRGFVQDVFTSRAALSREHVDNAVVAGKIDQEPKFGRTIWGLLSLELWQQEFHDRQAYFSSLLDKEVS